MRVSTAMKNSMVARKGAGADRLEHFARPPYQRDRTGTVHGPTILDTIKVAAAARRGDEMVHLSPRRPGKMLLKSQSCCAPRGRLIRALADVFGYDISDQKVHIGGAPIDHIMQLRSLCPRVSCVVDRLSAL